MSLTSADDHVAADVLDDRYELGDLLGAGGMADVRIATDRVLNREVAVKLLREVSDPAHRERFVAEARTLAALNHPGLITLLDAGIAGSRPYLVMELATGETLAALIRDHYLASDQVRDIGRQLADALAHAHECRVVHRDVKPSNVIVSPDGRVKLADFGIARLIGDTEHHTRTGETIGSPAYLAPEQVSGAEVTPAADVYALGLVLLEALTGQRAYPGPAVEAALARLHNPPVVPAHLGASWGSLITAMTAADPTDRPTAREVAAELGKETVPSSEATALITLDPDATAAYSLPVPPVRTRFGWRWLAAAAVVLACLITYVLVTTGPTAPAPAASTQVQLPRGVPARVEGPLTRLHRAVDSADIASLSAQLANIDSTIAAHTYPRARTLLRAMVADATADRDQGLLTEDAADRVVAAAVETSDALPAPAPAASATPTARTTTAAKAPAVKATKAPAPAKKKPGKGHGKHH